jgi:hypothetical protein
MIRLEDFVFLLQTKQSLDTVESWLRRTKGLKVGKHIDIRAVIFTSH